MGIGCNNNWGSRKNNKAVIITALIALVLINILDDDTTECVGQLLQATGELMALGGLDGCLENSCQTPCNNNGNGCYYNN